MSRNKAGRVVTGKLVQNSDGEWVEIKPKKGIKVPADFSTAYVVDAYRSGQTRAAITLAYAATYGWDGTRSSMATLYRIVDAVLLAAGIRSKAEGLTRKSSRRGTGSGEAALPAELELVTL